MKLKGFLGLAAIIAGIGILWIIVGKLISPVIEHNKIRVIDIYTEIDTKNIKKGTEFYKTIFTSCKVDSLSEIKRKIKINNRHFIIRQTQTPYRSRLNIKVSSVKNLGEVLLSEKIKFNSNNKTLSFYDRDSNLVFIK